MLRVAWSITKVLVLLGIAVLFTLGAIDALVTGVITTNGQDFARAARPFNYWSRTGAFVAFAVVSASSAWTTATRAFWK